MLAAAMSKTDQDSTAIAISLRQWIFIAIGKLYHLFEIQPICRPLATGAR